MTNRNSLVMCGNNTIIPRWTLLHSIPTSAIITYRTLYSAYYFNRIKLSSRRTDYILYINFIILYDIIRRVNLTCRTNHCRIKFVCVKKKLFNIWSGYLPRENDNIIWCFTVPVGYSNYFNDNNYYQFRNQGITGM